jgi:hypothetical protein
MNRSQTGLWAVAAHHAAAARMNNSHLRRRWDLRVRHL